MANGSLVNDVTKVGSLFALHEDCFFMSSRYVIGVWRGVVPKTIATKKNVIFSKPYIFFPLLQWFPTCGKHILRGT